MPLYPSALYPICLVYLLGLLPGRFGLGLFLLEVARKGLARGIDQLVSGSVLEILLSKEECEPSE